MATTMKTLVDLGGMENPRPLALKSDIGGYYARLDAIQVAINHVKVGIGSLSDKGGHIKWVNITGKPAASLTAPGVVTLSNTPSTDKTVGATLSSLRTANSDGWGFVPQERCINGIAIKGDINMVADDLWTYEKAQVDAFAALGAKVKAVRLGAPVQTALNAVPATNYITSFGGPGQPVWSRPLQFQVRQKDGTLAWINVRRTA
jgi:hypothetical protein